MPLFHTTLSLGRSDTIVTECSSKNELLETLTFLSRAVVRNIKEIVFSKDYNINYTSTNYIQGDTYEKVVIQALSDSFSETFVLFNIKKTVTKEDIQREFKQLLINNEPINDFLLIQFYAKGDSPINYDNLFQVQYKRNSKTYIENFYAKDWQSVLSLSRNLIDGDITEIRKFVHHDSKVRQDTGIGYFKSITASLYSFDGYRSLKIPKVDNTLTHDIITQKISNTFKVFGKSINKDEIKLKYS